MVNKRGWIRIVEASIAILIIFAALLYVSENRKAASEADLSESITPLLEEMAKNVTLREIILSDTNISDFAENTTMKFLAGRIKQPNINYTVKICDYDKLCGLNSYPTDVKGNVYAGGRVITSVLTTSIVNPKRVVIFLWMR